jgi:hypothetical protein
LNACLEKNNPDYRIVGYDTDNTKRRGRILEHSCGYRHFVRAYVIKNGAKLKCPICDASLGERTVRKVLDELDINYDIQVQMPNLEHKLPLRFDFCIYINGDMGAIEFDGAGHQRDSFGSNNHDSVVKNDSIKDNYCQENNIPLLRISSIKSIKEEIENWLKNFFTGY